MLNKNFEKLVAEDIDEKLSETEENYAKNFDVNAIYYNNSAEGLKLIPKYMSYMEYMIDVLIHLPRTEKFNLGNEYKKVMYETFEYIMYLDKLENKNKLYYLNKIDAGINIQRAYLRIMAKYNWISIEKFNIIIINHLSEIGRIIGGLIKYHAKNNKKSI